MQPVEPRPPRCQRSRDAAKDADRQHRPQPEADPGVGSALFDIGGEERAGAADRDRQRDLANVDPRLARGEECGQFDREQRQPH